jgi:hypothetical protein
MGERRRDGCDGRFIVTCAFETREATRYGDRLAHNPEVAFGPVPAQRHETALAPANRTLNDRLSSARRAASSRACSAA